MSDSKHTILEILADTPFVASRGADPSLEVNALEFDSRAVKPGALFFCVPGTQADGHDFAGSAAKAGAAALVVERELDIDIPQFRVGDARSALALGAARFYDEPSEKLKLVGITGTNGKTTTSYLTEHIARSCGKRTGVMGTVECRVNDEVLPSLHTTPESRDLQALLARMVEAGVDVCAMEVSSHALDLGRVRGTHFAVAAFTNLTQDHLDYHKTMENYFQAKAKLFVEYDPDVCVVCVDHEYGRRLSALCHEHGRKLIRVGSQDDPRIDVRVVGADYAPHQTELTFEVEGEKISFTLPLVGRFNVENALVAFGIGMGLGFAPAQIATALETAPQVPGRLERVVASDGTVPPFGVLVDYAHTPDSISKAVSAVKAVTEGRVICVFGCGGDRDHGKRPKMGKAALEADIAVVTSDNPRTEDPQDIIDMILPGMKGHEDRYYVKPDRAEAIEFAIRLAEPGDTVLIAGKGHEDYQIVGTEKRHFDDREVARGVLDRK